MEPNTASIIVLAGGKGTRLGASLPKPLVELHGTPLIAPILETARSLPFKERLICISSYTSAVAERFPWPELSYAHIEPLGTGYAVLEALPHISTPYVVVAQADDSFFIRKQSIERLVATHIAQKSMATMALATITENFPYAWVEHANGLVTHIHKQREDLQKEPPKDAAAGLYCFSTDWLHSVLPTVSPNPSGETPLPGALDIALRNQQPVGAFLLPDGEWQGVNTPAELEQALNRLTAA